MNIQKIISIVMIFITLSTQCMKLIQQPNQIKPKILTLHNSLINKIIIEKKNEFKDPYFSNLNKRLALLQELTQQETKISFINAEENLDYWFIHDKNRFVRTFYERLFIFLNYKTVVVTPSRPNFTDQKQDEIFITSLIFDNSLLCITNQHPVKDSVKKILNEFLGVYKGDVAAKEVITTIAKINKKSEITRLKHKQKNHQHTLSLDQSFITKFIQDQRKNNKSSSNDIYQYSNKGMGKLLLLQQLIDKKADVTYININNTQQPLLTNNNKPCQFFYDQLHFLLNYNTYSEREISINRVFFDPTTATTTLQLDDALLHITIKNSRPRTLDTLIKLLNLHAETTENQLFYVPEDQHTFTTEGSSGELPQDQPTMPTTLPCSIQQFITDISDDIT